MLVMVLRGEWLFLIGGNLSRAANAAIDTGVLADSTRGQMYIERSAVVLAEKLGVFELSHDDACFLQDVIVQQMVAHR